jgi:hypothetical protein
MKFTPTDIVAILIITGFIGLSALKIGDTLSSAMMLVIGYYFGAQHEITRNNIQ